MEQESLFDENEIIVEKARKHFIVYLWDTCTHVFSSLIFIAIAQYLSETKGMFASVSALLTVSIVLLFWVSYFYVWTLNYFDVWYVIDRHIIAVNQKAILDREVSFMEYSRIQDVLFEKTGILGSWLGYGKIRIQTAGTDQEFVLSNVRNVETLAHTIMDIRDKIKGGAASV